MGRWRWILLPRLDVQFDWMSSISRLNEASLQSPVPMKAASERSMDTLTDAVDENQPAPTELAVIEQAIHAMQLHGFSASTVSAVQHDLKRQARGFRPPAELPWKSRCIYQQLISQIR